MPTTTPIDAAAAPSADQRKVLSISQLNRLARQLLEDCFVDIWVEGEISNLSRPSSGHWYFSLKDANAQIRCAMFRNRNIRLRFSPEPGQHVLVRGRVSLYENRGDYQLLVDAMEPYGQGALAAAFEQLKARLAEEGLFDEARKRPLPQWPRHIAVVTSATGAAIHDILSVLARRSPLTRISILPVAVQGAEAAGQIAAAIARANRLVAEAAQDFDVLLVGRGGGSLEDLWAFNEEVVARAIVASSLPVVSAVGHETDFSIADFVADLRAPTPSAAAELLSVDQVQLQETFVGYTVLLEEALRRRLRDAGRMLTELAARLRHPGQQLRQRTQRVDELELRLQSALRHRLDTARSRVDLARSQLQAQHPGRRLQQLEARCTHLQARLGQSIKTLLHSARQQLDSRMQLLHSVSPLNTLQRGYAIVTDADGKVLVDATTAAPDQTITARLARGRLLARIETVDTDTP